MPTIVASMIQPLQQEILLQADQLVTPSHTAQSLKPLNQTVAHMSESIYANPDLMADLTQLAHSVVASPDATFRRVLRSVVHSTRQSIRSIQPTQSIRPIQSHAKSASVYSAYRTKAKRKTKNVGDTPHAERMANLRADMEEKREEMEFKAEEDALRQQLLRARQPGWFTGWWGQGGHRDVVYYNSQNSIVQGFLQWVGMVGQKLLAPAMVFVGLAALMMASDHKGTQTLLEKISTKAITGLDDAVAVLTYMIKWISHTLFVSIPAIFANLMYIFGFTGTEKNKVALGASLQKMLEAALPDTKNWDPTKDATAFDLLYRFIMHLFTPLITGLGKIGVTWGAHQANNI
jgi:hypothetical protein